MSSFSGGIQHTKSWSSINRILMLAVWSPESVLTASSTIAYLPIRWDQDSVGRFW